MPQLPVLSGSETVRNFERFGWDVARQRGSHIVMTKPGEMTTLSVPNHSTVAKGTLRRLRQGPEALESALCEALPCRRRAEPDQSAGGNDAHAVYVGGKYYDRKSYSFSL